MRNPAQNNQILKKSRGTAENGRNSLGFFVFSHPNKGICGAIAYHTIGIGFRHAHFVCIPQGCPDAPSRNAYRRASHAPRPVVIPQICPRLPSRNVCCRASPMPHRFQFLPRNEIRNKIAAENKKIEKVLDIRREICYNVFADGECPGSDWV